jgi:hypothetical protein
MARRKRGAPEPPADTIEDQDLIVFLSEWARSNEPLTAEEFARALGDDEIAKAVRRAVNPRPQAMNDPAVVTAEAISTSARPRGSSPSAFPLPIRWATRYRRIPYASKSLNTALPTVAPRLPSCLQRCMCPSVAGFAVAVRSGSILGGHRVPRVWRLSRPWRGGGSGVESPSQSTNTGIIPTALGRLPP